MSRRRRGSGEGTVYQRPDGLWSAQLTVGHDPSTGKQVRKTVYGNTQKEVLDKLDRMKEDARNGVLEASSITVWGCLDFWLAGQKSHVSPATYERYKLDLEYLKPYVKGFALSKFSGLNVTHIYQQMEAAGLSDDKRHKAGVRLRQAMAHAVRLDLIRTNPATKVKLPRVRREEIHPLTADQAQTLVAATRGDRLHALWVLALDTGARQGELFALEWSDWDRNTNEIVISKSLSQVKGKLEVKEPKTKGSRRRTPLSDQTAQVLAEHWSRVTSEGHGSRLIFPNTDGGWLRANNLQKYIFKPALKKAGLPTETRFHDLRHTCATLLLQGGVNIKVVSERLGHASVVITLGTYAHVMPGMQKEAAQVIGNILMPEPPSRVCTVPTVDSSTEAV